ncbi:MAG: bifunctional riboflavin kinase/FAD synthetase [Myxococcales bacterium]|nr:bifunctional riboflavin kinase/FAD synthetase [Myxococcales bacterium]
MEIFEGHRALFRPLAQAAVTIGNFDGVHLGHQELLRRAKAASERLGGDAVAMTFEPHPSAYLEPSKAPQRLTSVARKQELFAESGMSATIVEPFDADFAELTAAEFETQVLHQTLGAKHVVVGHDFGYGKGRSGHLQTLRAAGETLGFAVEVIEPVTALGIRTSSSEVRRALISGELEKATTLLGRDYDVDGPIVRGAARGREFGFPTANVNPEGLLLPRPGIYATWVQVLGETERHMAATSLGTNPTFVEGGALTLEAHILDFDRDIYKQRLRVCFVKWLRPEERYADADALLAQIAKDVQDTREILSK